MQPDADDEEARLSADPRLHEAIARFNDEQWYEAHDLLEELWHETAGPMRPLLQGVLQIAVAQLHRERGNQRGALILMGEGLGRLRGRADHALGLDLKPLKAAASQHLLQLQADGAAAVGALPALKLVSPV